MQLQAEIDDLGFSPSFNCYFHDSLTAAAAAKVSREFKQEQAEAQFHEFTEEDFEFSLEFSDAEISHGQIDLQHQQLVSPVSTKGELLVEEINNASSVNVQLVHKFYVDESMSSSSSEADELGGKRSGFLCMWRPKANIVSSPVAKCRKSSSTGTRKWRIHNFLRRSSSEGEETMFFLRYKKMDNTKNNLNVNSGGDITKVAGESSMASSPSFHELFFVQKKAQEKRGKMKSFLPYRQDLLGLFVNINKIRNKKSPL